VLSIAAALPADGVQRAAGIGPGRQGRSAVPEAILAMNRLTARGVRRTWISDGVRGLQPDTGNVIRPEVPVHDPRLVRGESALEGCPPVGRRRGQARPPEERVQLDHREAGDLTQADREG
jgi:hypothetical protein